MHTGPDSRFFSNNSFFSRFLADFDAQYSKLRFFKVEELIFDQKYRAALAMEPKLTNEIPKYQLFKNNLQNRLYS